MVSLAQVVKIRAAVLRKKGGLLRIESPEMKSLREDEVLVRLAASGISRERKGFITRGEESHKHHPGGCGALVR